MPRSSQSPSSTTKQGKQQPPRPPNAWILFRSDMSKSMPPVRPGEPRPAQSMVSKAISKMWAEASAEVKAEYERRAEAAKLEHMIKFPQYRFAPMKKEDRIRLREEKKREKDAQREQTRKARARPTPYTSQGPPGLFPPANIYGAFGPSPPMSAASSPTDTGPFSEFSASQTDSLATASTTPVATPSNTDSSPDQSAWPLPMDSGAPSSSTSPPASPWSESQTQSSQMDMVQFSLENLPSQPWDPPSEFDDHIHGFLSHTDDPSIFNLTFDPQLLVSPPEGELNVSFGQNDVPPPDFSNFDFASFWNQHVQGSNADGSLHPDLASLLQNPQEETYNADDFINYDATPAENPQTLETLLPPVPAPTPLISQPTTPSPKPYVPPTGASRAPLRRVGAQWPPSFTPDSNMDISPPRYSVPAS